MKAVAPRDPTDTVIRALATELKVSEDDVRAARSLKRELKMDSIAAANVAFMIEDECDIEIEFRDGDVFDTVESIVAIVRRALRHH